MVRRLFLLISMGCLLLSGAWACLSGGAPGGGPLGEVAGGPNIGNLTPPGLGATPGTPLGGSQEAPSMPDIAVGPAVDVVNDPNALRGPSYKWRVYGTASVVCQSTETETVHSVQISPMSSRLFRVFESSAHASSGGGTSEAQMSPSTITVHRLKVALKGQIQFNVDGGDFYDWNPESFPGDHVIRALDQYNNVVDTKIKEGGVIELSFLLSLSGEPSLSAFESAMGSLHFYRTPSNFPTVNLDMQKTCGNNPHSFLLSSCIMYLGQILEDMKDLVPAQPDYGASTDFSNVPECPPAS